MNYLDEAQRRWQTSKILGHGRYAVTAQNGGVVYLATTEGQAHNIALGIEGPVFTDLEPIVLPACADDEDDWEDRQRARCDRRELRFPL